MDQARESWQVKAQAKLESINYSIPREWRFTTSVPTPQQQCDVTGTYLWQFLSKREVEITETDAADIVKQTTSGRWSAEEVTRAFCHRASLAHQMVNCLHEIFFDAAITDSIILDEYYAKNGRPIGPLHGLPISLKDQFHVKGAETTMGYVGWIGTFQGRKGTGRERVFESEMVRELRALGAVLYCKTSVPHTLISAETHNQIIGYTANPKNRNLSAGGSSGGEGALIKLKGSPIGFGTDHSGSIRMPAAFNGLYGIRLSSGRLPYEGMANSMDGQNSVLSVVGPISNSSRSLKMMIKAILSQQPWLHDPLVLEIPWRSHMELQTIDLVKSASTGTGKLAFGVMKHDGVVYPHPPVRRAIEIVVDTLKKLGHMVFEWTPPSHRRSVKIGQATWVYDGGADVHDSLALSGEPMSPQVALVYGTKPVAEKTGSFIAANNVAKREYQKEYMEYWNGTRELTGTGRPADGVIAPASPVAATCMGKPFYGGYSTAFSVLDYTTVVIPVTAVDKEIDVIDKDYRGISDRDKSISENYDPNLYHGTPVGVQLVGRRLQEEKMLVLAEHIGEAVAARSSGLTCGPAHQSIQSDRKTPSAAVSHL